MIISTFKLKGNWRHVRVSVRVELRVGLLILFRVFFFFNSVLSSVKLTISLILYTVNILGFAIRLFAGTTNDLFLHALLKLFHRWPTPISDIFSFPGSLWNERNTLVSHVTPFAGIIALSVRFKTLYISWESPAKHQRKITSICAFWERWFGTQMWPFGLWLFSSSWIFS